MTPEERGIEVDRSIAKVYNQDKAMLYLEGLAETRYSARLDDAFEDAVIWWTTTLCLWSGDPAVIYDDQCNYGRMWSCQEIYVALPATGKTCGSALLHEYGHCLAIILEGHGDASHSGGMWPLVAEAHGVSCAREMGVSAFSEGWQQLSDKHVAECGFEE